MKYQRDFTSFLLYCFGFILVLEWIWPVQALTETTNISVFIVFLAFSFVVTYLGTPLLWSLFIKGSVIVYFLHWLYFDGSILRLDWVTPFFQEIQWNIATVFSSNIPEVSNLFRSLLFFILLWLMTYLLHYWLIQRRKLLLFFFVTIAYITILDTFTPYEATFSIIRTVIIGFFCLGVLAYFRLREAEGIEKGKIFFRNWLFPLSLMLGLSLILGLILPKQVPLWPDPVPYIQAFGKGEKEELPIRKVGYGTDDSRLGGPFIGDSTVVFRAETESSHYWKVETKDVYTGKGWVQSKLDVGEIVFSQNSPVPVSGFAAKNAVEKKIETSYVYQIKEYPHIVYPLGVKKINSDYRAEFKVDPETEKIYSVDDLQSVILPDYAVTFEKAVYRMNDLTAVTDDAELEQNFIKRYTQLPLSLPVRVKELAEEITAGKDNWYDKAKVVEQYLKGSDFTYDTKDVLIPGKYDDYVDQFLFESRRGYCDNFSTAMVVMLRALDIPARWVKGYTAGEYSGSVGQLRQYEITNDNAHSWVEVYFPTIGWVAFEPTPGFSDHVQYQADEQGITAPERMEEEPMQEETKQPQETEKKQQEEKKNGAAASKEEKSRLNAAESSWKWLIIVGITPGMIVLFVYLQRRKWLPYYYIWRFKGKNNDEAFPEAYLLLLKQLQRSGMRRKKGQTLREYASMVDEYFATNEMVRLTEKYEQYLYSDGMEKGHWSKMKELWEYLIKKQ